MKNIAFKNPEITRQLKDRLDLHIRECSQKRKRFFRDEKRQVETNLMKELPYLK